VNELFVPESKHEEPVSRKKLCTIIVAIPGRQAPLSVPVPRSLFYFLSFATMIGLLTLTIFVVNFTRMAVKVRQFNDLRKQINLLQTTNQQYETITNQLNEKLTLLEMLAHKVSAAAGFERKSDKKKTGEPEKTNQQSSLFFESEPDHAKLTPAEYMEFISSGSSQLEGQLQMLDDYYAKLNFKLAHTPNVWPAQGLLFQRFGVRTDDTGPGGSHIHSGIDIASPKGNPVSAAADGTISLTERRGDYGNLVIVDHGQGISTWYAHLSAIFVVPGQVVKKGNIIGSVGSTGRSTGPHLHYEIRRSEQPLNPMLFILGPS
jgi:murein DD-endopeptidase MepM/ murein hydrolase activator NlpD